MIFAKLNNDHGYPGVWRLRVAYADASGVSLGYEDLVSETPISSIYTWRAKEGIFTPPVAASTVQIRLLNYQNSGWIAFDNVELKKAVRVGVRTPNLVINPSFEDEDGWTVNPSPDYPATSLFRRDWGTARGLSNGNGYGTGDFPGTSIQRGNSGISAGRSGHGYVIHNLANGSLQSDAIFVEAKTQFNCVYPQARLDPATTGI